MSAQTYSNGMSRKTLISVLLILLSLPIVYGQGKTDATCLDADTLQLNTSINITAGTVLTPISTVEVARCPFGCANARCKEGSFLNLTSFSIVFIISTVFLLLGIFGDRWLFGFVGGTLYLIIGLLMLAQGLIMDAGIIPTNNLYTQAFGMIFTVLGLYLNILSALSRKKA